MKYAILGKTGLKVSKLGFGCMRLPMRNEREVDRELAIRMLQRSLELGVNYFDTAAGYHGGDSERVIGEAFEDVREQVVLSTKNPYYDKTDKDGWWRRLTVSLERLRTDYIDVYNHHSLTPERFEDSVTGQDGLCMEMLKAKEQGLIRHICCSYHGPLDGLIRVIDSGLFESMLVQYNLLDRHLEEGIAYAAQRGMGVSIMGPVGGGRLGYPSEKAMSLVGGVKSTPELALRFVLANRNVTQALSGMSTMQQLEENVETVAGAGELTEQDQRKINAAIEERKKLAGLYCTGCNYCMPCPWAVNIPANFELLNLERVFGLTEHARESYAQLEGQAALCVVCGKCIEACPQDLDIPGRLGDTVRALDERAGRVLGQAELRGGSLDREGLLHLNLRFMLKNLADEPRRARVRFLPHGEDQVRPAEVSFDEMRPYARRHTDIDVAVLYPSQSYSVDYIATYDGAELVGHLSDVVTAARRTESYSLDPGRRRQGTIHVPAPLHPIRASRQRLEGHSFDFVAAYDEENLYVYADVEDELLHPVGDEVSLQEKANSLTIHLDGRTPYMIGRSPREEGVLVVALYPPAEEGGKIRVCTSGEAEITSAWARTPTGYRVDCAIPWQAFAKASVPPGVIGFDIGMRSYDADGEETLLLTWSGRRPGGGPSYVPAKLVIV